MAIELDKLQGKKKVLNITIDQELLRLLKEYQENNKIISFSPMLNDILWDWTKNNLGG